MVRQSAQRGYLRIILQAPEAKKLPSTKIVSVYSRASLSYLKDIEERSDNLQKRVSNFA